jgi:AAA domain
MDDSQTQDWEQPEESQLLPEDVFTPRQSPSREMFTRRNERDLHGNPGLQDRVRDALRERGGQMILYGDTGVGKSTLLKYAAEDEHMGVLSIAAQSQRTYDDLIDMAIREVTMERDVEITRSAASGKGFEAGLSSHITIKGHLKNERGQDVRVELIERTPLLALAETMQTEGLRVLAFDNFQNVEATEREMFAQALEVLSDKASDTGDVKLVLIGIAEDAETLVGGSGSVRRRTTEIGVPRMPDDEISTIFASGFRLLGLECEQNALHDLVFYCDGFPYFAHLLGLAVSRDALRNKAHVVARHTLEAALVRLAQEVEASFPYRVAQAFERGGEVRPRMRILHTLCLSERREWRSGDVVDEYSRLYEPPENPGFLHAALGELVKPERGAVLTRRGPRGHYVFRFGDPYMRPFLRMGYFQPTQPRLF